MAGLSKPSVFRIEQTRNSRQVLRNVLVEDFLHRQGHDDFVAALEEQFIGLGGRGLDVSQRVSHSPISSQPNSANESAVAFIQQAANITRAAGGGSRWR